MNDTFTQSTPDAATDDALSSLTTSDRHRLLSATRRRLVLQIFEAESLPMSLDSLSDAVVEHESEAGSPRADAAKSAPLDLHHQHLPLMDDLGVLTYDASARRISAP